MSRKIENYVNDWNIRCFFVNKETVNEKCGNEWCGACTRSLFFCSNFLEILLRENFKRPPISFQIHVTGENTATNKMHIISMRKGMDRHGQTKRTDKTINKEISCRDLKMCNVFNKLMWCRIVYGYPLHWWLCQYSKISIRWPSWGMGGRVIGRDNKGKGWDLNGEGREGLTGGGGDWGEWREEEGCEGVGKVVNEGGRSVE